MKPTQSFLASPSNFGVSGFAGCQKYLGWRGEWGKITKLIEQVDFK